MRRVRGLGDILELITRYTGIKWAVKKLSIIMGFDCGCEQRQEDLNTLVPFNKSSIEISQPMMPPVPVKKYRKNGK